jgi:hypothetical protein
MPTEPADLAPDLAKRIRAVSLIRALERHVLKGAEMKPSQVTAALALLKKVLPDLSAVDTSDAGDTPNAHEKALRDIVEGA